MNRILSAALLASVTLVTAAKANAYDAKDMIVINCNEPGEQKASKRISAVSVRLFDTWIYYTEWPAFGKPGEEIQLDTRGKNCVISTVSQADAEFARTIK